MPIEWISKMYVRLFLSLIFILFIRQRANADKCKDCRETSELKLCVVESVHTAKDIRSLCPQLSSMSNPLKCVVTTDRSNCLRQLATGLADFTVLEPEDLIVATAYKEFNVLVTTELRLYPNEKQRFEMVVLTKKNVKTIWDVKEKRFCHPGHDTADEWTKVFSTYFEKWIMPRECDPEKTMQENKAIETSKFFESACIAGPWSADTKLDGLLKSTYKNLCAACDDPANCDSNDKYHGREGVLLCFTDNAGDIAWVRLDDALEHFKEEKIDKDDYNFLCPDGTTRPMKFDRPCAWISKPWPVVVARSETAANVQRIMGSFEAENSGWVLRSLLENYHPKSVNIDTPETPKDYLTRFPALYGANNTAIACRPSRSVRWCVSSKLEDKKCEWLRTISFVYGVEPTISCIREPTRALCLKAVETQQADIFVAMPEEMLDARKMRLKPILQTTFKKNNEFDRIVAVVKQDSQFHSLRNLKGAKACFTGYKDVGWNVFVAILRNISDTDSECSDSDYWDADAVGKFFSEGCVLGPIDSHAKIPYNLYSLCKQTGRVGDDIKTFDCLSSGLGDVAFVNLKNIEKKIGNLNSEIGLERFFWETNRDYRTLCLDKEDNYQGHVCELAWTPLSTIVAHENMSDLRREEIYTMLLDMDERFGVDFKGRVPAFSMYGPYDSNYNVIFPGETQRLEADVHQMQHILNYNDVIDEILKQVPCSGVRNSSVYYSNIIVVYISVLVSNKLMYV
ncbi:transferrin isoform X2 [Colletes gigas]|uniref:transferrin isoform X2 n=1 Tax=Colletes gigas TaxID=935657 RepID=UPI001C9ABFAA|nr:transferrin isoform X2 [Colletes gigas]